MDEFIDARGVMHSEGAGGASEEATETFNGQGGYRVMRDRVGGREQAS